MKAGYCRVSTAAPSKVAGKIRKIRCLCNGDYSFNTFPGNPIPVGIKYDYFQEGETGNPSDRCPVCNALRWYTI